MPKSEGKRLKISENLGRRMRKGESGSLAAGKPSA